MKNLLNIFLLLVYTSASGIDLDNLVFKNLSVDDGLTQNGINTIYQDSEGYMWFGTHIGVNRYNGYELFTYYHGDSKNDLGSSSIEHILEDAFGNVWIATTEGISIYNLKSKQFFNLEKYSNIGIFGHLIISIKEIDNYILISSPENLWRVKSLQAPICENIAASFFTEENVERIEYSADIQQLEVIDQDENHKIWFTAPRKIISAKIVEKQLQIIDEIELNMKPGQQAHTGHIDDKYNIWIGITRYGLCKLNKNEKSYSLQKIYPPKTSAETFDRISSIITDKSGNLWLASRSEGLLVIPKENIANNNYQTITIAPSILGSEKIKSLCISRDASLWVGSIDNGIYYYNRNGLKFKNYTLADPTKSGNKSVRSIIKDEYNRLWFGTLFEGLSVFNPDCQCVDRTILENNSIYSLRKVNDRLIIAACGDGLYRIDYNEKQFTTARIPFPEHYNIHFSLTNSDNIVWAGSNKGVLSFKFEQDQKTELNDFLPIQSLHKTLARNSIRCLTYDKSRACLWIGTAISGLFKAQIDSNQNFAGFKSIDDPFLSMKYICDIYMDSTNSQWIATRSGLVHFKLKVNGEIEERKRYTIADGLPSNMVQGILPDGEKYLWLGTNKGIVKFNKETEECSTYDLHDGMLDPEVNENAVFKNDSGVLYFGLTKGVSAINPKQLQVNLHIESTNITETRINGEAVQPRKFNKNEALELEYSENSFSFDFLSANYVNPKRCEYAYKLEGFQDQWVYTSSDKRTADFQRIPPGEYTFKVKASNEDGSWSSQVSNLQIKISPPFWLTLPAYALYLFVISLFTYIVSLLTQKSIRRKEKAKLDQEYREKIEKINKAKLQFFINISHEIRTPLTLIVCSIEKLLANIGLNKSQEKNLKAINSNVNSMLQLTNELLEIRKIETEKYRLRVAKDNFTAFVQGIVLAFEALAEKREIQLSFRATSKTYKLHFDQNIIEKVIYNLISNAIKYTPQNGNIDIEIQEAKMGFLELKVSDNGIGIKKEDLEKIFDRFYYLDKDTNISEQGFGIGLALSKSLMHLHKGYINATSEFKVGSTFTIGIPLNEDAYNDEEKADRVLYKKNKNLTISRLEKQIGLDNGEQETIPENTQSDPSKKTLLIIDDNDELVENMKEFFTEEYNVLTAYNGKTGFEKARIHQPDVILSDIVMPEMDGFELCQKLKLNVITSHIPLILLTARGDIESEYQGIENGADDFIPKPFRISILALKIKNILDSKEKLYKLFSEATELEASKITTNKRDEQFLEKLIKYVEDNISDPNLNIMALAETIDMGRSTFYRKIKAITGSTGKEFINSVRLKKACKLLLEPEMNISDVAYAIGHTSPQYFSIWFKSILKVTPSEYIEKQGKG